MAAPTEIDGMLIERDVPIVADDGLILRADVFRPVGKRAPAIMTLGPYGKGLRWEDGYSQSWKWMMETYPNLLPGSTRSHMTWETPDPDTWVVKWGYAVIRVDSRGAGRSPNKIDCFSPRETKDYYDAIEWAAAQPWCTGKIGLMGISYFAINQWHVASLQPPHLTAMIPWEGAADFYRDISRQGGICSNHFFDVWFRNQVVSVQHGNPAARTDAWTGKSTSGPEVLSPEQLSANRLEPVSNILQHPLDDQYHRDRSPDWSKVTVPFLSAASWAGFGLHPRGNFEAFTEAASTQKWLECHPGKHEEWFYLEEPMAMQKKFFDHFLMNLSNGWIEEPPVWLRIRRPFSDEFELRKEKEWPLARTNWTSMHISASNNSLSWDQPSAEGTTTFEALGDPVTFVSAPLESETELTGPMAAKIFISSSTVDADLFITLQAFSPEGKEVEYQGTVDPHTPLAQGWLRASHRKLDWSRSKPYRPFHAHDELQPLRPDEVYALSIEIWPTCIVLPAGFTIALQISGHDFERDTPSHFRGSGPFLHTSAEDRPEAIFGGKTTVHTGPATPSFLMLPVIG